ncbi:MAG: PIG-L deacetylase family protein, partial [Burkholderiaceae bacterium]
MPTEVAAAKPVALFLFAHQDDEFGVFQKMLDELQQGSQVCCAYLTRGARAGQTASRRERESVAVLGRLGVTDIRFAGAELGIDDATLPLHLEKALRWIRDRLASYACVRSIYVPAWEGGHHDHDALHAVTVHAAERHDMLQRVRQFPLYSACWRAGPFFKVLQPLPANGPVTSEGISWHNRWRFLACCLRYPSQASS